jgi:hypothetical protein
MTGCPADRDPRLAEIFAAVQHLQREVAELRERLVGHDLAAFPEMSYRGGMLASILPSTDIGGCRSECPL